MQLGKVAVVMAMILSWWLFNPAPAAPPSDDGSGGGSLARSDSITGR